MSTGIKVRCRARRELDDEDVAWTSGMPSESTTVPVTVPVWAEDAAPTNTANRAGSMMRVREEINRMVGALWVMTSGPYRAQF